MRGHDSRRPATAEADSVRRSAHLDPTRVDPKRPAKTPAHLQGICRDDTSEAAERKMWWLKPKWLRHRNTVEAVHPLLVRLREARGSSFMTCGSNFVRAEGKGPKPA